MAEQIAGVLDRQGFADQVTFLLPRLAQARRSLSMLVLEIDQLAEIRVAQGDAAADAVIATFVRRVGSSLRDRDVFGQIEDYGFAVLLPDCPQKAAGRIAERIRSVVAGAPFETGEAGEIPVTVSIGLTSAGAGDTTFAALVAAADRALDFARSHGRNRVQAFGAPETKIGLLH